MFQQITFNMHAKSVRKETMEGIEYTVVPMAMLTEGVHAGSDGPLLYTANELSKTPAIWNARPIVVYHPMFNGAAISAGDPVVFDKQKVGFVMNTVWDGKLRAEAWIDHVKADKVDPRVMERINKNEPMEVSTGVFTDKSGTKGTWNEESENPEEYIAEAVNFRPDHLALLPDKVGACSMADGAGLLVANALSHSNIHDQLAAELRERFGEENWVVDVYPDFVVFEDYQEKALMRISYTANENEVNLGSELPEAVVRVTEYRTNNGIFVGNASARETLTHEKEITMAKEKVVGELIANENTQWKEADREFLMGLDEGQLEKFAPVVNEQPEQTTNTKPESAPEPAPEPQPQSQPTANTNEPKKPATLAEFIASAPPEMQGPLQSMVNNHAQQIKEVVAKITANGQNQFSEQELLAMPFEQLQKMAALLPQAEPQSPQPLFFGASTPTGNSLGNQVVEEGMPMPTMNFDKSK